MRRLLDPKPHKRPTARECLDDPWFAGTPNHNSSEDESVRGSPPETDKGEPGPAFRDNSSNGVYLHPYPYPPGQRQMALRPAQIREQEFEFDGQWYTVQPPHDDESVGAENNMEQAPSMRRTQSNPSSSNQRPQLLRPDSTPADYAWQASQQTREYPPSTMMHGFEPPRSTPTLGYYSSQLPFQSSPSQVELTPPLSQQPHFQMRIRHSSAPYLPVQVPPFTRERTRSIVSSQNIYRRSSQEDLDLSIRRPVYEEPAQYAPQYSSQPQNELTSLYRFSYNDLYWHDESSEPS